MPDQDFSTALLGALMREAGALTARGMDMLSTQAREVAPTLPQFVLIECKPLAAHMYIVHPDGAPHEYYRETGDQLSDGLTNLVTEFITAGMNSLSVEERQDISRRIETEHVRLGIMIESDTATIRGLAIPAGSRLVGSETLFMLGLSRDEEPGRQT